MKYKYCIPIRIKLLDIYSLKFSLRKNIYLSKSTSFMFLCISLGFFLIFTFLKKIKQKLINLKLKPKNCTEKNIVEHFIIYYALFSSFIWLLTVVHGLDIFVTVSTYIN